MRRAVQVAFGIWLVLLPCLLRSADAQFFDDGCMKFTVFEKLLDKTDLSAAEIDTELDALFAARLYYRQASGHCLPTADTYLVGLFWGTYLRILDKVEGHHVDARIHRFNDDPVLLVFFSTGGNISAVAPYRIKMRDVTLLDHPFTTNLGPDRLQIRADSIVVTQRSYGNEFRNLVTSTYRYGDGSFQLVDEAIERLPPGPDEYHQGVVPNVLEEYKSRQSEARTNEQ